MEPFFVSHSRNLNTISRRGEKREDGAHPRFRGFLTALVVLILLLRAVIQGQENMVLVATGASMPEPLYKNWIEAFHKQQPSIDIRYMVVGTAESTRNILAGSGDLGGGDAPIPEAQLGIAGKSILELPAVLIGIVVIYELPNVKGELKLTGPVMASIFLGKIKL